MLLYGLTYSQPRTRQLRQSSTLPGQLEPQGVCINALKLVEDVGKGHSDLHIKPSNRVSHQTLSKLSVNAEPTFVSLSKGQHGSF